MAAAEGTSVTDLNGLIASSINLTQKHLLSSPYGMNTTQPALSSSLGTERVHFWTAHPQGGSVTKQTAPHLSSAQKRTHRGRSVGRKARSPGPHCGGRRVPAATPGTRPGCPGGTVMKVLGQVDGD